LEWQIGGWRLVVTVCQGPTDTKGTKTKKEFHVLLRKWIAACIPRIIRNHRNNANPGLKPGEDDERQQPRSEERLQGLSENPSERAWQVDEVLNKLENRLLIIGLIEEHIAERQRWHFNPDKSSMEREIASLRADVALLARRAKFNRKLSSLAIDRGIQIEQALGLLIERNLIASLLDGYAKLQIFFSDDTVSHMVKVTRPLIPMSIEVTLLQDGISHALDSYFVTTRICDWAVDSLPADGTPENVIREELPDRLDKAVKHAIEDFRFRVFDL
jgi:hypothetical protein